jgi:hypothetical protein
VVNFVFALHLLFAIFIIGPLVHAATSAGRGIRTGNGVATASSARVLRIYSYASLLVVIAGMGLMSMDDDKTHKLGEISQLWIWLSLTLWLVAIAVVLFVIVPTLTKATALIGKQESVVSLTARAAAAGGVVALFFAVIVFLMVYQPGK